MSLIEKAVELSLPKYIYEFTKRYFQLEILGGEHIPKKANGNCMLVMNHTAFFGLEVYLFGTYLLHQDPEQHFKTLVWSGFTNGPMGFWFKAMGCQSAKIETGVNLLKSGESVLIMPEGVGATDVRNKFNKFHTGFLRMVAGHPVPIIPVGFSGVDEAIPWFVSHNKWLVEKFMKPVDPNFDFMIIPKPPIFRPTKVVFKVGEPLLLSKEDLDSEEKIQHQTKHVQKIVEALAEGAESYRNQRINESTVNKIYHDLIQGKNTYI